MSESMSAVIRIGGAVKQQQIPALCRAIRDENVAMEWGGMPFEPGSAIDLLSARTEETGQLVLALYDDQARWGQFDALEQFLQDHQIAYDRHSDGKYEYDAQLVRFRPGHKPVAAICSTNGQPVIAASYIDPVRLWIAEAAEQFDSNSPKRGIPLVRRAQRWLKRHMPPDIPPLPAFEIV